MLKARKNVIILFTGMFTLYERKLTSKKILQLLELLMDL